MAIERDVVMRLKARADGLRDIRETTQAVKDLAAAQKAFRLEQDKTADRAHSASRKQAADDMMAALGMGNARPRRWDQNRRGETARQARDAAASILELHEAPAHLIEDVRLSSKNRRDKLHAEQSIKEQTHQQAMQSLMEQEIGKSEVEYLKLREKAIKAIEEQNRQLEIQKRLEQDLVKLGYAESQAMRGNAAPQGKNGAKPMGFAGQFTQAMGGMTGLAKLATGAGLATSALSAFGMALKERAHDLKLHYASLQYDPQTERARSNPLTRQRLQMEEDRQSGFWSRAGDFLFGEETELPRRYGELGYRQGKRADEYDYQNYLRRRKHYRNRGIAHGFTDWLGITTSHKRRALTFEQFQEASMSGRARDHAMFEAQQQRIQDVGHAAAESRERQRRNDLLRSHSDFMAATDERLTLIPFRQRVSESLGTQRLTAIERSAGVTPYAREHYLEDTHREIDMRHALTLTGGEKAARQKKIAHQLNTAKGQERELRDLYERAQADERKKRTALRTAIDKGSTGRGQEHAQRLNEELLAATEKRKMLEDEIAAAAQRTLEIRKSGQESLLQMAEREAEIRRATLQAVQQQRQALKQKMIGQAEDLALMNPMRLRTLHNVSQKIARGQRLTEREKDLALSHRDVLGKQIQEVAAQRTNPQVAAMIRDIQRNSGVKNREDVLMRAEVKLRQEIAAKVVLDEKGVTDALVKGIRPEIVKIMSDMALALRNEMQRIDHQRRTNHNAMFPDMPG